MRRCRCATSVPRRHGRATLRERRTQTVWSIFIRLAQSKNRRTAAVRCRERERQDRDKKTLACKLIKYKYPLEKRGGRKEKEKEQEHEKWNGCREIDGESVLFHCSFFITPVSIHISFLRGYQFVFSKRKFRH